ncbi:MAG TPA: NAD-dependent epimerase/dehydratase family protein [Marmoricola sp.]|nr:NAD-dependent epimerase/dehydratase family protein [Marmoricola sp.]
MATVLLTGASGFLGIHTAQHLLDAGHRVRAFVRDGRRLGNHLVPLGVDPADGHLEVVIGSMTDAAAVREAVAGCDSVVHAAATFSFKRRDREAMTRENGAGTRTVLEAGVAAGCSTVVQVSSTVALNRPGGATLDHTSPVGTPVGPYSASKIASEVVARQLQDAGAPVTIAYPGAVIGPHDPYLGESNALLATVLAGRVPAWPRGRIHLVDVRETAAVLTAAVTAEPGGRYPVPGESAPGPHGVLADVTGRRMPAVVLPGRLVAAMAAPGYATGWSFLPGAVEGIRGVACANPVDAKATAAALGVAARPLSESVADTVRWLVDAGHVPRKAAGRLAG